MSDLQAIGFRFQIEALRGEYADASMMRDWDRFASCSHTTARGGSPMAVTPACRKR